MDPQRTSVRDAVGAAYGARAAEYTELLGSVDSLAARDRDTISAWGTSVVGPVLDAGCGPGHWTEHLRALGVDATGIDLTPEFVDIARSRFPEARFRVGALESLPVADAALGGLLSWYSVIHTPPEDVPAILREFARVLRPGGSLLLGCFEGPRLEAFDHAVTTAYFWPVAELRRALECAGFAVRSVRTRTDAGSRPHAEYLAERVGEGGGMIRLRLETRMAATPAECFALSLSVDAHTSSMSDSRERAVGGVTSGEMRAGQTVTWLAVHFGIPWRMTSLISAYEAPHRFIDEQVSGPFARWHHEHRFEPDGSGTRMLDLVEFSAPLGPFGRIAERIALRRYMTRLLERRNAWLRETLEGSR